MRIVHVTKRFPGAVGGDATVVAQLAKEQASDGHRVVVVTSRVPDILPAPGVHRVGLTLSQPELDHIGLRRILSLVLLSCWALVELRALRPDVLHVHSAEMGAAVAPAAALHRVPRIITLHYSSIADPRSRRAKRWLETLLVRAARYQHITTVDAGVVGRLPTLGRRPARFVPNPVSVVATTAEEARDREGILFVGRFEHVKGVSTLLSAMATLVRDLPTARLVLVGEGPLEDSIRAEIHDRSLVGNVVVAGPLPREEVHSRMRSATVLVIASSYEGTPMVLLEAWASSLAVVTTAVGSIPVICDHDVDVLVVAPGDPDALARALYRVLTEGGLAERLGAAGRAKAEESFRPERVHAGVMALYRDAATRE
jgi:glycosyltransferase involved in cell wall biosynthesis